MKMNMISFFLMPKVVKEISCFIYLFIFNLFFLFFLNFILFFKLYVIVLLLPNIKMKF